MVKIISPENHQVKITMTNTAQQQLNEIKAATGERTSELIRRLIQQEALLIRAGFMPGHKQ
ncbi:hypothetical protein FC18_GL001778 [Lacticaseibacillus sharpeae JCM 1186 = DSM 20505]|uniref:Ribbon-helix-helix protein CopG domain-containing protein n=1 Tax=Lacticaseibacillus sharpeae JCM 1186 = DSM 20505 TaxID=1291052 RepID=A0A0R1ZXT6_9LACO|nr:hypothetical protein FC18_GL001778 [Lacticaseibacillus sharpeae JCM 1186 = DSM 20505]